MKTEEENEAILRNLARIDWLAAKDWKHLHAPVEATYDATDWCVYNVIMACGWRVEWASIPGWFSRMGAPRCSHCCDRLGFPRGIGSPKNDDRCRELLGL